MLPPRPTTAINCEDGRRRHFARMSEMRSSLGLSESYVQRRINSGTPCKGWLIYDDDHATSPEAVEAQRRHVKGYEEKEQRRQAKKKDALVSVRIDAKTVILVKASKWTPDFAERYREKLKSMNGIRSTSGDVRRFQNVRGGRQ